MNVVRTKWVDGRGWVCSNCDAHTKTVYIATGHDHTDEVFDMCDCGAGVPFAEKFQDVKNPIHLLSYYQEYL